MSDDGSEAQALSLFHPVIRRWFRQRYGNPTDIQLRAWPCIASGSHVLLTAPTGSGKTLCAFLWAINQLVTGQWSSQSTRVLYVSPLKALNNDIRRNLIHPLREIRECLASQQVPCPDIRVLTRSGDTPARERQQMLRRPPEILITTPESLNLLLASPRAREKLRTLQTVILDEIHAIAMDKRGTHLVTAVERLVLLSGEFQRIALSATVKPAERVGDWIGGYRLFPQPGAATDSAAQPRTEPEYRRREITIIRSGFAVAARVQRTGSEGRSPGGCSVSVDVSDHGTSDHGAAPCKQLELCVRIAGGIESAGAAGRTTPEPDALGREAFWSDLVREIKGRIRANRSTLIFTNTRRHAEKLARLINEDEESQLAYAHHGSLSREIRLLVEKRLKAGELSAIVATSSLELGIDIGALDEVLLVQTPASVSSALQRIGRAGHGVGEVSRGRLYCTHGRDLLNAAVMARSIADQDIEEIRPIEGPLDLLAQIILSMTAVQSWQVDELYDCLRSSSAFHDLPRKSYDLVLEMLAGRYEDRYLRELKARLSWDRLENTVQARRGALPLVYRAGGTIPDRGYYDLRVRDSAARIGELDEEFVWERKVGDTFNLGTQNWKIVQLDSKDVVVVPWNGPVNITPFWCAEKAGRDFHFSEKVGLFLEAWNDRPDRSEEMTNTLLSEHFLDEASAHALIRFLERQRAASAGDLPHRHHLLIEHVGGALAGAGLVRVILHTLWGSRVNYPFSLILEAAWRRHRGDGSIEVLADDDCLLIIPSEPEGFSVDELLDLVQPGEVEGLLRESLEGSGFFAARFRENAGRALLLPRSNLDRRIPLWLTRMRARKLLEGVRSYADFPLLLETWRSCLRDEFDLASLNTVLTELSRGRIRRSTVRTKVPSPFADNISWIQTNQHMYQSDVAPAAGVSAIQADVIREILYSTRLRPRIEPRLVAQLSGKLQRTAPGYAPSPGPELLDWVKERQLIEDTEWRELIEAVRRDHGRDQGAENDPVAQIRDKLVRYRLPGAGSWMISALERMQGILRAVAAASGRDPDALIDMLDLDAEQFQSSSPERIREVALPPEDGVEPGQPRLVEPSLSVLVADWLRCYGPVSPAWIEVCFGVPASALEAVFDSLVSSRTVVMDRLIRDAGEPQVCDAENLEILLRLTRKGARPSFTAVNQDCLAPFLATQQGVAGGGGQPSTPEDLRRVLEILFGFPAPVRSWEEEILPARLKPYHGRWLDELLHSSELQWFGCGRQRIAFCFASDLDLFLESNDAEGAEDLDRLLPSPRGKFSYWDLVDHSRSTPADTTRRIWELVWKGRLTADSFDGLRKAAAAGFRLPDKSEHGGGMGRSRRAGSGRSGYDRWRASHPLAGNWYGIESGVEGDLLEVQELDRVRARQLLRRYGILFRELLNRELPALQWARLFRTLRIMELSGEILSGYFFEGIPGLQFISHGSFRRLKEGLPEDEVYWVCAADPASACGLGLTDAGLTARLLSNHLVYHGSRLVMVSTRRGREVEIRVSPGDDSLHRCLGLFADLAGREAAPRRSIRVERINGLAARESPYRGLFLERGFTEEYKGLILRAGY